MRALGTASCSLCGALVSADEQHQCAAGCEPQMLGRCCKLRVTSTKRCNHTLHSTSENANALWLAGRCSETCHMLCLCSKHCRRAAESKEMALLRIAFSACLLQLHMPELCASCCCAACCPPLHTAAYVAASVASAQTLCALFVDAAVFVLQVFCCVCLPRMVLCCSSTSATGSAATELRGEAACGDGLPGGSM